MLLIRFGIIHRYRYKLATAYILRSVLLCGWECYWTIWDSRVFCTSFDMVPTPRGKKKAHQNVILWSQTTSTLSYNNIICMDSMIRIVGMISDFIIWHFRVQRAIETVMSNRTFSAHWEISTAMIYKY